MKPPVKTKSDMYRRLVAGEFGNTIPVFFSLEEWQNSPECGKYDLWGIRNATKGGDSRMRLNVATFDIADLYKEWYPDGGGNISPMIDQYAVLRGEVWECDYGGPMGLNLFYVPPGMIDTESPWRGSFKKYGQHEFGIAALSILQNYLWPSDYEDMKVLLDNYPGHVIEFSACDREVGLIPKRNTIVWEVRRY